MRIKLSQVLVLVAIVPLALVAFPERARRSVTDSSIGLPSNEDRASENIEDARARLAVRDYRGALRMFEKALGSVGPRPELHMRAAVCAFELGDYSKADEFVTLVLDSDRAPEEGPELLADASELSSRIREALSFTLEFVLPELRDALVDGGELAVSIGSVDGGHCRIRAIDQAGRGSSFDLADLAPHAGVHEVTPVGDGPTRFSVRIACPFGDRIRAIQPPHRATDAASATFEFADVSQAEAVAELFERAVRAITESPLRTRADELERIVAAIDQRSMFVGGDFVLAGGSEEHSSFSTIEYSARELADGFLSITRESEDSVDVDARVAKRAVEWIIDLAEVESVSTAVLEKRAFGSWLVRGRLSQVSVGDLEQPIHAVIVRPRTEFARCSIDRASGRAQAGTSDESIVLPVDDAAEAERLAMAIHCAAFLTRERAD